jgi:hypothetical protein
LHHTLNRARSALYPLRDRRLVPLEPMGPAECIVGQRGVHEPLIRMSAPLPTGGITCRSVLDTLGEGVAESPLGAPS